MTYEEIMGITPGSIVPNGFSITPNATYIGPGEPILDAEGNAAPGGHYVNKWDKILVLDIGYTRQLTLIQYPVGNNEVRQGYITNSLSKIEYSDLENNFWQNGSTTETVYLSCSGDAVLGSLNPHERAIFLYKAGGRYSVVYSTDKGPYTKSGFVKYPGGISDQITQGRCLASGGSLINGIPAGGIVPGGRTYPANANAQVDLDVRDAHGNSIPGREVNAGDELTVLDVGYTRQLALVQYPAGGAIRQGYVTNNARYIKYKNPNNWYNGSTPEPVLDGNGVQIGTINPYEMATRLYEANGLIEVVYNTDKGINTKSGFVKYPGTTPHVVHVDIPYPNVTSAELINYGTSGKGRPLRAYKIGNGRNSFIYNCAIHGWEDNWPADGVELTKIGNQIIEHFQNNSTGDFTLYVIPAANPDGVSEGWTNNGPGRCTIVGGIDCNRDFPVGFTPGGRPRNYTGAEPLSVPESRDLANFVQGVKNKTAGKTYLIDMHGWEQSAIGSSIIGEHFVGKLGLEPKYRYANAGYLIDWANSIGIISTLLELPTATHSHADVVNGNYAGKIIEGLTEIMGTSSSSTGGGESSKVDIAYQTVGQVNDVAPSVHVRKGAGTGAGCDVVTSVNSGELLMIIGEVQPGGETLPWYKIDLNGQELYIRSDFVNIVSETKLDEQGTISSSEGWVHVRKLPGTGGECTIITTLNNGVSVEIVGKLQPKGESISWYKVRWQGGVGFIRSDFVAQTRVSILVDLYNKAREFYPGAGIATWNEKVFDYLRQNKYGNNGDVGVVWNQIITPDKAFYAYVNKDINLKQQAEIYMGNKLINMNGSVIGLPHLSATTLGYIKTNLGIPDFWTGWGGDLATVSGEVIKASAKYANTSDLLDKLYTYAYSLIGGESTFGLDNFYEDIDAIYFAKNIGLYPIYELINNYYENLVGMRQSLITDSIKQSNTSLADSIYNKFIGPEGIGKGFEGVGLFAFVCKTAGKELVESIIKKNGYFITNVYKVCSEAFAARINSLNNQLLSENIYSYV